MGNTIDVNLLHPENNPLFIDVKDIGIVNVPVRLLQFKNTFSPTLYN